jgi:hypothetical protein
MALLEQAQTFTADQTFTGAVIVPDSTTATHALNRQTGDARYGLLGSANTWDEINTFNQGIQLGYTEPVRFLSEDGFSDPVNIILQPPVTASASGDFTVTIPSITGDIVINAGNQSISGTKTFTTAVVVPDSTTSSHALRVSRGDARYCLLDATAQSIAGTKRFTGILRATEYRSDDNSVGIGWTVRLIDADSNQYDCVWKNGILTQATPV